MLGCRAKHKSHGDEVPPPPDSAVPGASDGDEDARAGQQPLTEFKQPQLLRGFNFSGESSCFPLAPGRRCLSSVSPLATACQRANGELVVCDDCRQLCSQLVKP
jgi:hypothetical protein